MGHQTRLLLVEDDAAQRRTIEALLSKQGFDVKTCDTISSAREQLGLESFPVCVMDQRLPDGNAIEFLSELYRDEKPRTRFIINTGYGSFSSAKDAVNIGVFAYVEKLGDPQELVTAVHRAAHDSVTQELYSANQEVRLQMRLLDAVQHAVIATDLSFRVLYWNRFAESLFGRTAAEAMGTDATKLILPSPSTSDGGDLMAAMAAGQKWVSESEVSADDDQILTIETTVSPIFDAEQQLFGLIAVSSDISERLRLQQQHETLQEQFYQSQKLESIGRLAGGIAHDFNNIMCAIQMSAELLKSGRKSSPQRTQTAIETILQSGVRAQDMTRQLLAFSRRQKLDMKALDLNEVVQEFTGLLNRTLREDIAVELSLAPSIKAIYGDVGQLEQVLLNLVLNAQDAMPDGGAVGIETAVAPESEVADLNNKNPEEGFVRLRISDCGVGIPPEILDQIFEPFFTTKPHHLGTGLGLATVLGVIQQHGGDIRVASSKDSGTVFSIYLPAVAGKVERNESPDESKDTEGGGETILLVEDNEQVRLMAQAVLESQGYVVHSKGDPIQALEYLREHSSELDLLLTDFIMPGMNGRELAERATLHDPRLRVLFMSGYTDTIEDAAFCLSHQQHFLSKPFTIQQLTGKVQEALQAAPADLSSV